jgi:repressor LexA
MRTNLILTPNQKKIYDFILKYIKENGQSPTIPEIAKALKFSSLRSVTQYLEILERKGLINREKNKNRNIRLIDKNKEDEIIQLPVFASAGCGSVTAERIFDEFISISTSLIKGLDRKKMYVIRAIGDSMQDEGINSGDYVLVEKLSEDELDTGDKVVAIIEDDAVIKRYLRSDDAIILESASKNKSYRPIILDKNSTYKIFGKVLRIIRIPKAEQLEYVPIPA